MCGYVNVQMCKLLAFKNKINTPYYNQTFAHLKFAHSQIKSAHLHINPHIYTSAHLHT